MTAAPDDLLLPDDAVLMHIGPQKTGSTALQAAARAQRAELRRQGVTAVGLGRRERLALWTALMHPDSREPGHLEDLELWAKVLGQATQAKGRVLFTHESLGKADAEGAERMVTAFGGSRVHVLAVARRLDRLLPSQWQQRVKTGGTTLSYEQWLEVVLGDNPDDPVWQNIWVPHDLKALVDRWVGASSRERFVLVVADESDRRMLSRVVEAMLGVTDGVLRPDESHTSNASLSYERLELLRRLGEKPWSDADASRSAAWLKAVRRAVKLAEPVPGETRVPPLSDWALDRVRELSRTRADLVRSLDVRVVGDPDHLLVPGDVSAGPTTPAEDIPTELAARVLTLAVSLGLELDPGR